MINFEEINSRVEGRYQDSDIGILTRHNAFAGCRNYVLAILEQLQGHLRRELKNDDIIKFLSYELFQISLDKKEYSDIITEMLSIMGCNKMEIDKLRQHIEKKYNDKNLNQYEKILLKNISEMHLSEYEMMGVHQQCDYHAMVGFTELIYQILIQGVSKYIEAVEFYVDTNGVVTSWNIEYSENVVEYIWFEWNAIDKIEFYYWNYKSQCKGLLESSMNDLASADAVHELLTDEKRTTVSYNMLARQYCGVIEKEVNELIQLLNFKDKPKKHLMWNDMKQYISKHEHEIDDVFIGNSLSETLDLLHPIRNAASHGERISYEQYKLILSIKERQFFELLSCLKLHARGKMINFS